jgi:hypothetical protein
MSRFLRGQQAPDSDCLHSATLRFARELRNGAVRQEFCQMAGFVGHEYETNVNVL